MIEVPRFDELEFDDEPHIYRLDGMEIPSVSAIMQPLSEFEYGTINRTVLDNAADRGTSVHNSIENWIKFGIDDYEQQHEKYFNAFLDWWKLRNPKMRGSELRTYHKILRYAGTVDLLAEIGDKLMLVDFKTTSKIVEKNCGVQLEAYAQALRSHGLSVEGKMILQLKKDGTWKEMEFPAIDTERWRVFGSLKIIYDYMR